MTENKDTIYERDGGGGAIRFEKDNNGGVHVYGWDYESGEEELVFSLGREDTSILARTLLRTAGVRA